MSDLTLRLGYFALYAADDDAGYNAALAAFPETEPIGLGPDGVINTQPITNDNPVSVAAALSITNFGGGGVPMTFPGVINNAFFWTSLYNISESVNGGTIDVNGHSVPWVWEGYICQSAFGGCILPDPAGITPPNCLDPTSFQCFSLMGEGTTYDPEISGGDVSLNTSGGYRDRSYLRLGLGGGASTATIDVFGGTPLALGAAGSEVGIGFGIQFAVDPVGMTGTFALLWEVSGNISAQLYGREVSGVREYEWRRAGTTVITATPKVVSEGKWDVLGLVLEVYHLVCNVASADCSASPFGTSNSTVMRFTDMQTNETGIFQIGGSTGITLDDMTFHRSSGSTSTGWTCTYVAYRRSGIVVSEVTIPASCLSFLGQTCTVSPIDVCMTFTPRDCVECFGDDTKTSPPRIRPPQPGESTTIVQFIANGVKTIFDPIGDAVVIGTEGEELTPDCIREDSNGLSLSHDENGPSFSVGTALACVPIKRGSGPGIVFPDPAQPIAPPQPPAAGSGTSCPVPQG